MKKRTCLSQEINDSTDGYALKIYCSFSGRKALFLFLTFSTWTSLPMDIAKVGKRSVGVKKQVFSCWCKALLSPGCLSQADVEEFGAINGAETFFTNFFSVLFRNILNQWCFTFGWYRSQAVTRTCN